MSDQKREAYRDEADERMNKHQLAQEAMSDDESNKLLVTNGGAVVCNGCMGVFAVGYTDHLFIKAKGVCVFCSQKREGQSGFNMLMTAARGLRHFYDTTAADFKPNEQEVAEIRNYIVMAIDSLDLIEAQEVISKPERKHSHYFKDTSAFDEIDTYLLCRVWQVKDDSGALHHALKKILDAGKRGSKGKIKDVTEARDTLNRYLEIEAMFDSKGQQDDG